MHTRTAGPASTRSGRSLCALAALVALGACRDHDPLGPDASPSGVPPQRSASWAAPTRWVPMAPAASSDWEIRAAADMNGDGKPDVVWQNRATRQTGVWIMDGTTVQGWVAMPPAASGDWEIAGAANLRGDATPDIVWQNRVTRETGVWEMDGTTVRGWVAMPPAASGDWEIAGVADMNGDGKADVVWQNRATRQTGVWIMDGTSVRGWVAMPSAASGDWEIAGAADLSGDWNPDVVWQNRTTRETGAWEMDGTTVRGWVSMPLSASSAWQIGGVADLSGDGRLDIVWQNRSTRETGIWEMGGGPPAPPAPPSDALHKVSYTSFWSPPYGMRAAAPWLAAVHTGQAGVASRVEIDFIQLWAEIDGVPRLVEENTYDDKVFGGELRDRSPWFGGAWETMPATPANGVLVIRPGDRPNKVWHPYLEPCGPGETWPCDRQDISRATRVWFEARIRLHGPVAVQAGIDYYEQLNANPAGNRLEEGAVTDWEQTQDQWITLKTERSTEIAGRIALYPEGGSEPSSGPFPVGRTISAIFGFQNADDDRIRFTGLGIETRRLAAGDAHCDWKKSEWVPGFEWTRNVDLPPGRGPIYFMQEWTPTSPGTYCIRVVEQREGVRNASGEPIYQQTYASPRFQTVVVQ